MTRNIPRRGSGCRTRARHPLLAGASALCNAASANDAPVVLVVIGLMLIARGFTPYGADLAVVLTRHERG